MTSAHMAPLMRKIVKCIRAPPRVLTVDMSHLLRYCVEVWRPIIPLAIAKKGNQTVTELASPIGGTERLSQTSVESIGLVPTLEVRGDV